MPGSGSEYISGSVPYNMVPQVVNPSDGYIVSSNQRQVGPAYPFWYGNTMSFSDGFRAMMERMQGRVPVIAVARNFLDQEKGTI